MTTTTTTPLRLHSVSSWLLTDLLIYLKCQRTLLNGVLVQDPECVSLYERLRGELERPWRDGEPS